MTEQADSACTVHVDPFDETLRNNAAAPELMRHIRFHNVESGESPFLSIENRRVISTERIDGWDNSTGDRLTVAKLTSSRTDLREKVTVINLEKVGSITLFTRWP